MTPKDEIQAHVGLALDTLRHDLESEFAFHHVSAQITQFIWTYLITLIVQICDGASVLGWSAAYSLLAGAFAVALVRVHPRIPWSCVTTGIDCLHPQPALKKTSTSQ